MKKRLGCLVGILLILLLLLGIGAGAWLYRRAAQNQPAPFVQIRDPQSGALTDLNETLPLTVYAEASRPILRLEVYADGALIAAANGTQNTLTLTQPWAFGTPGRHVLLARAFFSADEFADSAVVFVDTADLSGLPVQVNVDTLPRGDGVSEIRVGDLAAAAGTTPAEIARLNPSLPAAPEAVIPPAMPLSLPRRSNPPPAALPEIPPPAPGAPGMHPEVPPSSRFDGETHTCSAISLRWSDAPDETAYLLYRLAPGEAVNTEIARLPANQTTYTDNDIPRPGTYHYMLAPQRPSGGSITSLHSVEIAPDCAPAPAAGTTSLQLVLLRLRLQKSFDGVYCYASVNGSRYERIPAGDGLLRPSAADWSVYQLPMQIPSRGAYPLSVPADGTVDFALECWGRRGALSESLGEYIASHPSADWDGRTLSGSSAVTALNPNTPKSYLFTLEYRIARPVSALDITRLYEGALEPQYLNIPPVLSSLSAQVSGIPSPFNVALEWGAGCDPLLYLYGEGGYRCALYTPQIRWSWFPSESVTRAMLTGFTVQMEFSEPGNPSRRVPGPQFRVDDRAAVSLPLLPLPLAYRCGTTAYVTVIAHTAQGNSAPSAPLVIRQPDCKAQKLRVRITSIEIGPSNPFGQLRDDGDICILCDDRRLEVFGAVYLNGYGVNRQSLGHGADVILFGACPATTTCLTAGTYPFTQFSSQIPWLFEVDVPHNGSAVLTVNLTDYDTQNGPDPLCVGSAEVQIGPLVDKNFRQILTIASNFGEAACRVNAEVTLAP